MQMKCHQISAVTGLFFVEKSLIKNETLPIESQWSKKIRIHPHQQCATDAHQMVSLKSRIV
jgi:hypothetical protein